MKTFSVEKPAGESVVISRALSGWNAATEYDPFLEELLEVIDDADETTLYYIADLRDWKPDLTQIILAANKAARGTNAILHHPKIKRFLVITELKIIEMAAKGLDSEIFGNVPVSVFDSVEEAVSYVHTLAPA